MNKEDITNLLKLLKEDKYNQEINLKRTQIEITDVSNKIKQVKSRIEEEQTGTVSSKIQYLLSNGSLNNYIQKIDSKKLDELDVQLAELTLRKSELIYDAKYANNRIDDYTVNKKLILEQYQYVRYELSNTSFSSTKESEYNPDNKFSMLVVHYQYYGFNESCELIKQYKNVLLYIPPEDNDDSKWIKFETDKLINKDSFEYKQIQNMINNIKDIKVKSIFT